MYRCGSSPASKARVGYTYGAQSPACPGGALSKLHAVVTAGANTYCYDLNGNMTMRSALGNTYTFGYDYENRLTSVSGAATATFTYDGDGNRVKSVLGATTTLFVGSHYESSGGVVARYYLAGGTRVVMRTGSASFYWLLSDHPSQTAA